MSGMYWVTRGGFVVQQRGPITDKEPNRKVYAYNVPTGGFRGLLRLDKLRPATPDEVANAKGRKP